MRKLLHDFAASGRTVLLSSHILHDVQETCTHAAILRKGRVVAEGRMGDLLGARKDSRIVLEVDDAARAAGLARTVAGVRDARVEADGRLAIEGAGAALAADVNRALVRAGLAVSAIAREDRGLEARFLEWTEDAA